MTTETQVPQNKSRKWQWLVIPLVILLSFSCVFISAQGALMSKTERVIDANMLADSRISYHLDSSDENNFAPLNANVIIEATHDAGSLEITPLAPSENSPPVSVAKLPDTPTPEPTATSTKAPATNKKLTATTGAQSTSTPLPPTDTPVPSTNTPLPPTFTSTATFAPTSTDTATYIPASPTKKPTKKPKKPTNTPVRPTSTSTLPPSATPTSSYTPTSTQTSIFTPLPTSTRTSEPTFTSTPTSTPTNTPTTTPTDTPIPTSTDTPIPTPTDTPIPTSTDTPIPTPTDTPIPPPTDTPIPPPTKTPIPAYKNIRPKVSCVRNNGNGTYTAYFGYNNRNDYNVNIAIGDNNRVIDVSGGIDQGQPTNFSPGQHDSVFNVDFEIGAIWMLDGNISLAMPGDSCP